MTVAAKRFNRGDYVRSAPVGAQDTFAGEIVEIRYVVRDAQGRRFERAAEQLQPAGEGERRS